MSNEITAPAEENISPKKQKKSVAGIINIIINVVLVLAIILAAVCTYVSFVASSGNGVPNLLGFEIFSVQTDSMYPTLKSGDLVIDRAIKDASTLRKGDIITYWTVLEGERVLNTHRIYEIYDGGGHLIFETKGDNNNAADSLTVHESEVVGVYSTHISGLGKVLDYLQTSKGFLIVVVIPVALFFLFHLIQFFRALFEYQNVKSRLKYQEELDTRGTITDAPAPAVSEPAPVDKAAIEAQIREQLKAEMMAQMLAELKKQNAGQPQPEKQEQPTEEQPEEAVAETETESAAEPEAEAAAETETESAAETESEPEAETETESAAETESEPEAVSEAEAEQAPAPETVTITEEAEEVQTAPETPEAQPCADTTAEPETEKHDT